jgi:hypothetical protein
MRSRLELHEILCDILGSRNVYFQPPTNVSMRYPAIVYNLSDIENRHADDGVYSFTNQYQITLIDRNPETDVVYKINQLQTANFIRSYSSDNLNHWVFEIFF